VNRDEEQNPFLEESEKQVSRVHFGTSCCATDSTPKQAKGQSHMLKHNYNPSQSDNINYRTSRRCG
jgi:hypothetical protein